MIRYLATFLLLSLSLWANGQEICDNGIDDDGDGLIDLNDEECVCSTLLPSSLIPNPSFEQKICCPMENARLDCAIGWIQASSPTTDYVHTCDNYLGNTSIPAFAPLPFPDGEGAVGFRDGQGNVGPQYKEYVGACLTESMVVGESYSLDFFVGFRDNVQGSKSLDIAIFGSDNCANLPFGGNNNFIGCPANTGLYDQIDVKFVSGSNEWVRINFEFVPTKPYEVIIIGPECAENPNYIFSPYFYLDGLTLAETAEFGIPFEAIEGSICNDDLVLSIGTAEGQSYQWYKDGIALAGETGPDLNLITTPEVEGTYMVVINLVEGCVSSKEYEVRVPPYYAEQEVTICENDEHIIGTTPFTEQGTHVITISAVDGCDSIVTLMLNVDPNTESFVEDILCEGETFTFLDIETTIPGQYQSMTSNSSGCDSTIYLDLIEIPKTDGIELPTEVEVELGKTVDLIPNGYDPLLINFNWYTEDGTLIDSTLNLENYLPVNDVFLTLVGKDSFGCEAEAQIKVTIDKSSITVHFPNVFSPDGNNINDFFNFIPTPALLSVESFEIYDRWGNQVYLDTPLTDFQNSEGWDGLINGKEAIQGVYGYILKATFLDNSKQVFTGDLTLIRL